MTSMTWTVATLTALFALLAATRAIRARADSEATPTPAACICKPTMKVAWEPVQVHCGATGGHNTTHDWLLHTALTQISKHHSQLEQQRSQLLTQHAHISQLQKQLDKLRGQQQQDDRAKKEKERAKKDKERAKKEKERAQKEKQRVQKERESAKKEKERAQKEKERAKKEKERENEMAKREKARRDEENKQLPNKKSLEQIVETPPKDCGDIQLRGVRYSGVYNIQPVGAPYSFPVFCDLNNGGGGWTLIQRRMDGSQRFNRSWHSFKYGFGDLLKEFWLGNDKIHWLSNQRIYEVEIDLLDYQDRAVSAVYSMFSVAAEQEAYTLSLGSYTGNAGDSLGLHNGCQFTTYDRDNDHSRSGNCAHDYGGGWWYQRCYDANLNGIYANQHRLDGIVWYHWKENHAPIRWTEMKIRPVGFTLQ